MMLENISMMHSIDSVIILLRALRELHEANASGKMNNQVYLHISRDLEAIVEELTIGLLTPL